MILKIHGCSGAGKTTAVRQFLEHSRNVVPGKKGPEAYQLWIPGVINNTYILGSYENTCGGVDTVGSAAEVMTLLDKYAPIGNVIFEGLLQSTYYGAMGTHSLKYGNRYIYAFLDTPIELCLERVVDRRAASGRQNKFNPQLTRDKHRTIENLRKKLTLQGVHRVAVLKHDGDLAEQIKELLK